MCYNVYVSNPVTDLLARLGLVEARRHIRHAPTDTCSVDGLPWRCPVRVAADRLEEEQRD